MNRKQRREAINEKVNQELEALKIETKGNHLPESYLREVACHRSGTPWAKKESDRDTDGGSI